MKAFRVLITSLFVLWKWRRLGLEHFLKYTVDKKVKSKIGTRDLDEMGIITEKILYVFPFKQLIKPTCLKLALIQFYIARRYVGEVTFVIGFKRYVNDGMKKLGGHAWILINGQKWPNDFDDSAYTISYTYRKEVVKNDDKYAIGQVRME